MCATLSMRANVTYGIYGIREKKIRPHFNALTIDDNNSPFPLRFRAPGQTLSK